jgi:hypothetical protein
MFWQWFKEKPLKTVWRLNMDGRVSYLVGTAHFFPHSFPRAFQKLFAEAEFAIFEGPLDNKSMERVVSAGTGKDLGLRIVSELDRRILLKLADILVPACKSKTSNKYLDMIAPEMGHPGILMIRDMAPWLAFFSIYIRFVRALGWRGSVDMEAYDMARKMGKQIVFLETIEEQIQTLESLSEEGIMDFFTRIDNWKYYSSQFVEYYLEAEVEKIKANEFGFPTRRPSVIDHRDERFCDRAHWHFKQGGAVFCVGVPHIPNMKRILERRGYQISPCS